MTTHEHRTPEEIERDIERERAGLTTTLDTLQDRFSVDHLVHQVGDHLRRNGGDIGRSVADSVKQNPLALTLTGVGLAWLIFGSGRSDTDNNATLRRRMSYDPADRDDDEWAGTSRPRPSTPDHAGRSYTDGRHGETRRANNRSSGLTHVPVYRQEPSWARRGDNGDDGWSASDAAASARDKVGNGVSAAAETISDAAAKAGNAVSGAASSVGNAATSAASGAASAASRARAAAGNAASSVADAARSGRDSAADGLAAAHRHISDGTEALSREARERVIAARARAIAARDQADRAYRRASARASDFYEEQPLVAGLLAMAAGAAIAGALPRSRAEDEHLGEYSDALIEEAERIFREETEKAKAVAQAAADEARKIGRETKRDLDSGAPGQKSAAEAVADKVRDDGKRIANAARKEAEKQDLGKPNT